MKSECCFKTNIINKKVKEMNNGNRFDGNNYEKLKCIWMASQIIEYKLCDNNFECENCVFDNAMRNLINKREAHDNTVTNVVDVISEKLQSIKYDNSIIYLKNNLVAKKICANTFYLGIDPVFSCFLDNKSSLVLNDSEKNIKAGQSIFRISGSWGTVNLLSPMNFIIYDRVANSFGNPLDSQWQAIIGLENRESFWGELLPEEWEDRYLNALNIIKDIKMDFVCEGETMADGGTHVKFLHQLLGSKKYAIILNVLINK